MKTQVIFLIVLLLAFCSMISIAQIPRMLSYQGVLTDSLGNPKSDGSYTITFRLYTSSGGGSSLWNEQKTVLTKRGLFSTILGDQTPLADSLLFDKPFWLSLQIESEAELSPRLSLTAVGYSLYSVRSDTARFAISAPQQPFVDSSRIAGNIPDDVVTSAKIVNGTIQRIDVATGFTSPYADTALYARNAPQGGYVDSARIAGNIPDDIVTSAKIANGTIQRIDVSTGFTSPYADTAEYSRMVPSIMFVDSSRIATTVPDSSLSGSKILRQQVVRSINQLKDNVVLSAQGGATITSSGDTIIINAGSGSGGTGIQGVQNTNNTLEIINPNGPTATINVKNAGITSTQISDNAVTSTKILDGTITGSDIAGSTIGTANLNFTPATRPLAPGVSSTEINDGAVTQTKIASGVTLPPSGSAGGDLTGTYPNPTIGANAVTTAKLADGSVTSAKILDATIATANITDNAITTTKIITDAVTTTKILNGTIQRSDVSASFTAPFADTAQYARSAPSVSFVDSARIASTIPNNIVTSEKIAPATVLFSDINQNSATTGQVMKWNGSAWVAGSDSVGSGVGVFLPLTGGTMSGAITNTGNPPITMGKGNFGSGNINTGVQAFVAGGNNRVRGDYSVVGGGGGVNVGDSNSVMGTYSVIAGGRTNVSTGVFSTIGGGDGNHTTGSWGTIAGGQYGNAAHYSFIGGGWGNAATGMMSTVCGGGVNKARGKNSVVIGGGGTGSGIADSNSALGDWSTVLGGYRNIAGGKYSLVAGKGAKALHDGTFIWADSSEGDFISTAPNQFLIRAYGGVGINKSDPASAVDVNGVLRVNWPIWPQTGEGLEICYNPMFNKGYIQAYDRDSSKWGDLYLGDGRVGIGNGAAYPTEKLQVSGVIHSNSGGFKFPDGTVQTTAAAGSGVYLPLAGGMMTGPITNTGDPSITMGKGNFGSGNINTGENAFVAGGNNRARGNYSVVCGGGGQFTSDSNSALGDRSFIGAGYNNTAASSMSVIGGGYFNRTLRSGSVIGGGVGNQTDGEYSTIVGGVSNRTKSSYSTVGGGGQNYARGSSSVVAGGGGIESDSNSAMGDFSTISGGSRNIVTGEGGTVSGGKNNRVRGNYSVISGGGGTVYDSNSVVGNYSVIGGGIMNALGSDYSVIGGGQLNKTFGNHATVGGGVSNNAGAIHATIGGGSLNIASGFSSTVAGGMINRARGQYSVVSGGGGMYSIDSNSAIGDYSAISGGRSNKSSGYTSSVAGGYLNYAEGQYSTSGGGLSNLASGEYATVPGGINNRASGNYSFAAGRRARAVNHGTFTWADGTDADFTSTGVDQFLIRASGGVGIGTAAPEAQLHVAKTSLDNSLAKHTVYLTETHSEQSLWHTFDDGKPYYGIGFRRIWQPWATNNTNNIAGIYAYGAEGFRGGLVFKTNNVGTANSEPNVNAMVIRPDGNVGIGTKSPAAKLQVLGDVAISGALSKGSGSFKIDHPIDPEHKYLYHSFVESPDMKNIYDGVVTLDEHGEAAVLLPSYFQSLNSDYRYQLTCIGGYAPVYIAEEIKDNTFRIGGGKSGMKVSWQVSGIRQDPYANAHRIIPEVGKKENEIGKYLYPTEHGQPETMGISYEQKEK